MSELAKKEGLFKLIAEAHDLLDKAAEYDGQNNLLNDVERNALEETRDRAQGLFEIITGIEEVKWDFFAGSITEIKVKNGDIVEAGDVVMIGEVGGTTREVVSEVGGRITIDITIGEELSKNQKLATVDIIEDVVSPVKGQTEQLYVSEGDEVEAGQVLAGVISTVTYEKDSYFYINQEGENIGPFESAQGFTFKKSFDKTLAYHDPCELGRLSGIFEPPRKILENIPGVQFQELTNNKLNCNCCGNGGGINSLEPEIAMNLSLRKIEEVRDTSAELLVSSCPNCRNGLGNAIIEKKQRMAGNGGGELNLEMKDITELVSKLV